MKLWVKIVIGMSVLLLLVVLFFWPKSECGYDQGYGDFTKTRCTCLGFIEGTPELDIEIDSKKDYSCFGIKIGETKIISQWEMELKQSATYYYPITIPPQIKIDSSKSKTMEISFYNKGQATAVAAKFVITDCIDHNSQDRKNIPPPEVDSTPTDIPTNISMSYEVKITENGLIPNRYLCTMSVINSNEPEMIYESKQFFLKVNE